MDAVIGMDSVDPVDYAIPNEVARDRARRRLGASYVALQRALRQISAISDEIRRLEGGRATPAPIDSADATPTPGLLFGRWLVQTGRLAEAAERHA